MMKFQDFPAGWRAFCAAAAAGGAFVPSRLAALPVPDGPEAVATALTTATVEARRQAGSGPQPAAVCLVFDGRAATVEFTSCLDTTVTLLAWCEGPHWAAGVRLEVVDKTGAEKPPDYYRWTAARAASNGDWL